MRKILSILAAGIGLALSGGTAQAVSSACSLVQVHVPLCNGDPVCIAYYQTNHPECFGSSSSTAASTQTIYSTSGHQFQAISNAFGARLANRPAPVKTVSSGQFSGLAAGDTAAKWNVWGSVNADNNKYDRGGYRDSVGTLRNNTYNINVSNVVLGADYLFSADKVAGLSLSMDRSSGTGESFNAGVSQGISTQSSKGYLLAPYFGWQISDDWAMDASIGIGKADSNTDNITGSTDRLFLGANLSYATWRDNWQISGKGSLLHAEEKNGNLTSATGTAMAGTAVTNKINQLRMSAQANYWVNDNVAPYLGLGFSADSRSSSASAASLLGKELGTTAVMWSLGVDFFSVKNSLTGGISYSQESGRTYSKYNSIMANINYSF